MTGGPGGSGVGLATRAGSMLVATRLGPHYDLIGFDPRGTLEISALLANRLLITCNQELDKRRTFVSIIQRSYKLMTE